MMDLFPNAPMNKRASDNLRNLATINLFDRYTIAKSMMWSFRVGLFDDSSIIGVLCIASSIVTHYYMFNGSMVQWIIGCH